MPIGKAFIVSARHFSTIMDMDYSMARQYVRAIGGRAPRLITKEAREKWAEIVGAIEAREARYEKVKSPLALRANYKAYVHN